MLEIGDPFLTCNFADNLKPVDGSKGALGRPVFKLDEKHFYERIKFTLLSKDYCVLGLLNSFKLE